MCGIVGYVGNREALPVLLEGLKRLEYRGYDSAGVVTISENMLHGIKTAGRIQELEKKLNGTEFHSQIGIAHTRWATHGAPTEQNAHPHYDCKHRIAVAHNGIIENYQPLKRMLIAEGHAFSSETDTEVLAHLIEKFYTQNLGEATRQALRHVRGAYGIAVVAADQPNLIVAARHGSPLVIGVGNEGEYFIASDVAAILPYTKKVVYPNDGELVRVSRQGFQTITLKNEWVAHGVTELSHEAEHYEKGIYPHYMLKEIMEEPEMVRKASAGRLQLAEGTARLAGLNLTDAELRNIKRVLIIGCGSAFFAALAGRVMIEELAGIPVEVAVASEYRYRRLLIPEDTLVFVISQSGETADTIAALREVKRKGTRVYGISNVVGSTIARETDGGMFIYAGPEIGVATTKAFVGQLTVLALFALHLGRLKGLPLAAGQKLAAAISRLPEQITAVHALRPQISEIARAYVGAKSALFLGRKASYPIALEGALKLKEVTYIHAEGYPAGEMKHGPIALIDKDFPSFVIAPRDSVYEKTVSNIEEICARGGDVIAVATVGDNEINRVATHTLYVPPTEEVLTPLLTVVPFHLLAYEIGVLRGFDVDKPRNLAKSVTVE